MAQRGPWSTFAQDLQTVAAGASTTFVIALPSIPYLDEPSRSPGFDLLNVYVAAQVGTLVANWTMTVDITFQPVKNGPTGTGRQVGVTTLTFNQQIPAAPGMGLVINCTNNGGAPDTIAIAYGGIVAPAIVHPDGDGDHHQPPTYGEYMLQQKEMGSSHVYQPLGKVRR